MNRRIQKILTVALIAWIALIWGHSMMPASESSEESRIVGEIIRPLLEIFVGEGNVTDFLVRKLAHFTEYMVLGCLLGANVAVRRRDICSDERRVAEISQAQPTADTRDSCGYGRHASARRKIFWFTYALLLAMAIALIDESIQIFSPGRSPQITDVLLDTCGSFAGLLLLAGFRIRFS